MEKSFKKTKIKNEKRKIKKFSWKLLFGFIVFEFIFSAATGPFVLLYGPFESAKNMFVGTAMNSMHYQWLATTFLSQEKIDKIMGKGDVDEDTDSSTGDSNLVSVSGTHDDTIKYVELTGNSNFIGHVLIVHDSSRIKIGYTSKLKEVGEPTSVIAENNNAVAAVNGGAFSDESNSQKWSANGGNPSGVIISNGKTIYDDTAGIAQGTIAMKKDGKLVAGKYTIKQLKEMGVTEAVSFDTDVLIADGKKKTNLKPGSNPRTLIGQTKDGYIVLVVLDSAKENRITATLKEAQDVMASLGCVTAATLDGGKSTTMYYEGEVINKPSFELGERYIPTAVIVK